MNGLIAIRRLIWLYFWLLIFEGALRKWFLPGLATPLLVVRDPIALAILLLAIPRGLLPLNLYVVGAVGIGILGIVAALVFGHGNLVVAVYGARILLLHFPLVFVIACVFDLAEVIRLGKAMLLLAGPMTILITLQFYSPQSAWVNRGLAGDLEGAGFSGAMGFFRPPGTFSFTNGNTMFYGMLAPFVVYFGLRRGEANRWIWLISVSALLIAVPLSISRGLFFQLAVTLVFALIALARSPRHFAPMLGVLFTVAIILGAVSTRPFFSTAVQAFNTRFEMANEAEGGVQGVFLDRFLGGMIGALSQSFEQPFFGAGIGMGTNAGAKMLTGKREFLVSEGEWGRMIGEMGPLLGLALVGIRVGLALKMLSIGYRIMVQGNLLPWLILSFALLNVAQGQWAQPTSLGFAILSGGLALAACRGRVPLLESILQFLNSPTGPELERAPAFSQNLRRP